MKKASIWRRMVERFKAAEKQPARPEMRVVAAASLRDRWSGYPSAGLTPARLASILREADQGYLYNQAELFEEMEEKDAHLAAVLQTRKQAVLSLDWNVTPCSEDAKDQEIAAFCDEAVRAVDTWEEGLLDLLDAVGKGYAAAELLWKVDGRQVGLEALEWIHPKRITLWDSMTPRILTDNDLVRGIEPPPWKIVFHRYRARSGHDTRAGVLRVVAYMYLFKNYAMKDWATFNEVFGMPLRLGKYEPSASTEDREALITAIRSLGSDAAGVISKSTEVQFVEASSRLSGTTNPFEVMCNFCNREISKAVLGQTLTTDTTGGTGTYAAGKVHDEVRRDLLEADAKALGNTVRMQILKPLVGFNFGWEAPVPYFEFNVEEEEDLKAVAETYKILKEMGYPLTLEHVSDRFGVPLPEEGQELLAPAPQPAAVPVEGQEGAGEGEEDMGPREQGEEGADANGAEEAEKAVPGMTVLPLRDGGGLELTEYDRRVLRVQEGLDDLAGAAMAASAQAAARMLAPVKLLVAAGKSLEEIRDGLLTAYPEMDMEQLGELLYQANMLAWMSGRGNG